MGQVFALGEEEKCLLDSSLVLFEILEDLCASSSFLKELHFTRIP